MIPLPGSSYVTSMIYSESQLIHLYGKRHKARTLENLSGGNVQLTSEEKAEIDQVVDEFEVKGDRYGGQDPKAIHLWG